MKPQAYTHLTRSNGGPKNKDTVNKPSRQDFLKTSNNNKHISSITEQTKKDKSVNNQILQSIKNVNKNQNKMAQILDVISSKINPKQDNQILQAQTQIRESKGENNQMQ